MHYIRTKQAEEEWSLHQYNFIAGSRKTVPLACRSEDRIKIPTQNSRRVPPVVKATVRIFSSRNDLSQSLSFHNACWVPKIVFSVTSCPKWKRHALTSKLGHTVVTALWMAVSKSAKTIARKTLTPNSAASDTVCLVRPHRTLDVYWPVRKMQVAHSVSMSCKYLVEKLRCWFECHVNVKPINGAKQCKLFLQEHITIVFSKSLTSKFCRTCSHLMFFWPCIMNWLYINYQLDALIIIYS